MSSDSATSTVDIPPGGSVAGTVVEVLAIVGRRLRHLRRAPGRFIGISLNPLVSMLVLGYLFQKSIVIPGGGSYQEYLFAGAAIQVGLAGVGPTAIAVAADLRGGMIDRFRSLPISRSAVLTGHSIADLLISLAGLVVVTGVGLLLGWRAHHGFLPALAGFGVLAAFLYAMIWLGVLLGMSMRSLESIDSVSTLVVVVFPFLSNAFLSAENLPGWLRPIAEWNPVSAVATACRNLWGNPSTTSGGFPAEHPSIVVVVTLGLLFAVTTLISLRSYRTRTA